MSLAGDLAAAFQAIHAELQARIDTALAGIFPFGTVGAPGLRFEGDADTGIRRSASNTLALVAGGTDALTLANGASGGSAVQASPTDTTAGLLLKTGAFGLGEIATAPLLDDFDALDKPTGFYRYTHATAGPRPTGVDGNSSGGVLIVRADATNFVLFLWRNYDVDTGIFHRKYNNLAWSDWVELYNTTTIVGRVSESAGVPVGAIIESGSNANGDYVRYADGTQICAHTLTLPYFNTTRLQATWTYPAQFESAPAGRSAGLITLTLIQPQGGPSGA